MIEWLRAQPASKSEVQQVAGGRLIRVADWTQPQPCPVPPNQPVPPSGGAAARAKRVAVDLLPPVVTRVIKRARARVR
jgi:hypothetical protein